MRHIPRQLPRTTDALRSGRPDGYGGPQSTISRTQDGEVLFKPPIRRLAVAGFVICHNAPGDGELPELDRAGDWIRCKRGDSCPERAYLTPVYTCRDYAEEAVPARAERFARGVLSAQHRILTKREALSFKICSLAVEGLYARDYCRNPCGLDDALLELRFGDGGGPAWRELHRQRAGEDVQGALLPGGFGTHCNLFMFLSAKLCIHELNVVEQVGWQREEAIHGVS
jgi:hypothetical protein